MIRIHLVDDHAIVREGLKQLFSLSADLDVVGESVNGAQLLDALRAGGIDLVLLDMSMPGIGGVQLIERIRSQYPVPVLVLSMHNEPQIARRAIDAGATGYLTKDNDPEMLMLAIRKVARGGRFVDPLLAQRPRGLVDPAGAGQAPHEQLSDREQHILCLLVRGLSVNQIADQLAISNKTVSTHKARLMQKMQFGNNAELVKYGVEHGLT